MSLVNCPECNQQISDKATACIHCGCPMEKIEKQQELICPEFSDDLSIGELLPYSKDVAIYCNFEEKENDFNMFSNGMVKVHIHKNGIRLINSMFNSNAFDIHKSQIIKIDQISKEEITTKGKSVIGRAIIGGILTGGIGAIIGGMSGIGNKTTKEDHNYLIINFWDKDIKKPKVVILKNDKDMMGFINKINNEMLKL